MTGLASIFAPLVSAPLLGVGPMRTTFQWGRIHSPEDWLLPIAAGALVAAYVWWMYRRDVVELRRPLAYLLTTLRTLAWIGLFLVWLQPQWRNEEDVITPSRVVVLADTSLSMAESAADGTTDASPATGNEAIRAGSRAAAALRLLENPAFLAELRKTHEVHLAGFDGPLLRRIAVLERDGAENRNSEFGIRKESGSAELRTPNSELHFAESLAPRGAETRIGEALNQALYDHRAAPVSGVIILTDGGQNTGLDPLDALSRAGADRVPVPPIFPIGLGSTEPIRNLRVQDLVAPPRTYPTDEFNVTAFLQAQGMEGRTVGVELTWRDMRPSGEVDPNAPPLAKQTKTVTLPADGKPLSVEFALKPTKVGRTSVSVAIANRPSDDRNPTDDLLDAEVEVTERRNHVLLFAAAATREYQFLRNQLQRIVRADGSKDKEFVVDVCLQTGSDGISQDSSEILPDFPDTAEAIAEYDCVVAFDPDWRRLTTAQMKLLHEWVEEKAGGMIVVAGRIHTDELARDPNLSPIRGLYPVEFGRALAPAGDPLGGTDQPWRVGLTPEGRKSEFLRLSDTDAAAFGGWDDFEGFYDYYSAKGVKDKATVLASLVDPRFKQVAASPRITDDARPFLMVEHSVGAGRVLYLAGGELWRLRKVNAQYFTRLYTQLVRHVAQARLLRGSKRGVLMVDHDNGRYSLNDVVEIRAQLMDARAKPYEQPYVELQALAPDRTQQVVRLERDPQIAGNYRGLLPVRQVGPYRLDLQLPDGERETLTRRLQVRVPNKESDDVRLNAALLQRLASASEGTYFQGTEAALGRVQGTPTLASRLLDKTRITPRLAKPVSLWDNQWTMAILCGLLGLEWLIRRLVRLA
jgi:hypothetical protein